MLFEPHGSWTWSSFSSIEDSQGSLFGDLEMLRGYSFRCPHAEVMHGSGRLKPHSRLVHNLVAFLPRKLQTGWRRLSSKRAFRLPPACLILAIWLPQLFSSLLDHNRHSAGLRVWALPKAGSGAALPLLALCQRTGKSTAAVSNCPLQAGRCITSYSSWQSALHGG